MKLNIVESVDMLEKDTRRLPGGASEEAIQMASEYLEGAPTWGFDNNRVIYARVSEGYGVPVGVDRGTEKGVWLFMDECQKVLDYQRSIR